MALTLLDLKHEYFRALGRTDRRAQFLTMSVPRDTCRYCGRFWRPWNGSKLDGHAKCMVDESFRFALRTVFIDPRMTYQEVAKALGVTPSVVRAWSFPMRSAA